MRQIYEFFSHQRSALLLILLIVPVLMLAEHVADNGIPFTGSSQESMSSEEARQWLTDRGIVRELNAYEQEQQRQQRIDRILQEAQE